MAEPKQRAYKAGIKTGEAIVEMVHLFYQNNTAAHFYRGLFEVVEKEMKNRNVLPGKKNDNAGPSGF